MTLRQALIVLTCVGMVSASVTSAASPPLQAPGTRTRYGTAVSVPFKLVGIDPRGLEMTSLLQSMILKTPTGSIVVMKDVPTGVFLHNLRLKGPDGTTVGLSYPVLNGGELVFSPMVSARALVIFSPFSTRARSTPRTLAQLARKLNSGRYDRRLKAIVQAFGPHGEISTDRAVELAAELALELAL